MKKNILFTPSLLAVFAILTGSIFSPSARAHGTDEAMKAFVEPYGKIQSALAQDDLSAAQAAAKSLPLDKNAQAIASSKDLDSARAAFKELSKKAIGMTADGEGYYAFKCPMVDGGYWMQTSKSVSNPYLGKAMPTCGKLISKEDVMKVSGASEEHDAHHQ